MIPQAMQRTCKSYEQQQPAPMLHWMAKDAREMTSVVTSNISDAEISDRPACCHDR